MGQGRHRGGTVIEVTAETIAQSLRANSNHCMIADAIKAALPDAKAISVDLQTIRFTDREKGRRVVFFTPLVCQQQLVRFDQGVHVKPWTFRLPLRPAQTIKVVAKPDAVNKLGRPLTRGPKKIQNRGGGSNVPGVEGGEAPPTAVLAHNSRGQRRVFGIRAAKGFDSNAPVDA